MIRDTPPDSISGPMSLSTAATRAAGRATTNHLHFEVRQQGAQPREGGDHLGAAELRLNLMPTDRGDKRLGRDVTHDVDSEVATGGTDEPTVDRNEQSISSDARNPRLAARRPERHPVRGQAGPCRQRCTRGDGGACLRIGTQRRPVGYSSTDPVRLPDTKSGVCWNRLAHLTLKHEHLRFAPDGRGYDVLRGDPVDDVGPSPVGLTIV